MQITPPSLSAIRTQYSKIFQEAFFKHEIFWPRLAQLFTSTAEFTTHVWMDRIPQLRKWVGDRIIQSASLRTYQLANVPWELTEGLDRYKIADDQLGLFEPVVRQMAEQAKKWPDTMLFNATTGALPNGQSVLTYDNQNFYSTTHPVNMDAVGGPVQSNYSASGMALNAANYNLVRNTMRSYRGADGLPMGVRPSLLVVPPALETQAIQILKETWMAPAVAVGMNAASVPQTNPFMATAEILVIPDLAGQDTRWYLLDNTSSIKPFIFQLRDPAEFVMKNKPDDPAIFSRHEIQYGVSVRGAAGYGPWFYAYSAQA